MRTFTSASYLSIPCRGDIFFAVHFRGFNTAQMATFMRVQISTNTYGALYMGTMAKFYREHAASLARLYSGPSEDLHIARLILSTAATRRQAWPGRFDTLPKHMGTPQVGQLWTYYRQDDERDPAFIPQPCIRVLCGNDISSLMYPCTPTTTYHVNLLSGYAFACEPAAINDIAMSFPMNTNFY